MRNCPDDDAIATERLVARSTHHMRLGAEVLPRIVVTDDNRIVADGPTDSVLGDEPLLEAQGLK